MSKITHFQRAIFLSWYCSLGDCKFCYMSTQKNRIRNPKLAKRSFESIFAEALLARELGWKIEFLSGGYESYSKQELLSLVMGVFKITQDKQWLNLGILSKDDLKMFSPYTEGYSGTIETVNWKLREEICPSKKLEPILRTFSYCDELGLKKATTIIIGLGETIEDFANLKNFIERYGISRITFYALNPHPGTSFKESPDKEYYCEWVRLTRNVFPKIEIIAGAWSDKKGYYSALLNAGADDFTKLPALRLFGSSEFKGIEQEIKASGRKLSGSLTRVPKVNWDEKVRRLDDFFDEPLKRRIKEKLKGYLASMKR